MNNLVIKAVVNTLNAADQGPKYFERPAGSFVPWLRALGPEEGTRTAGVLKELARDGVFTDVTDAIREVGASFGLCRYYRAAFAGMEAACLLSDLSDEQLASVRVVKGAHGIELQAPGLQVRPTDHLHVCVGNAADPFVEPNETTAVVYFWAPGRVLPRTNAGAITVKLGG